MNHPTGAAIDRETGEKEANIQAGSCANEWYHREVQKEIEWEEAFKIHAQQRLEGRVILVLCYVTV